MILEADEVEAEDVGALGVLDEEVDPRGVGGEEDAEFQFVPVVHRPILPYGVLVTAGSRLVDWLWISAVSGSAIGRSR